MKNILFASILFLFSGICQAQVSDYGIGVPYVGISFTYEITRSTFNSGVLSISTSVPTLVSLSPAQSAGFIMYSVSLWNISSSSMVYTLDKSSSASSPLLTCANGLIIGSGTEINPFVITEQFEGLYMWVLACGSNTISNVRRAIRGR